MLHATPAKVKPALPRKALSPRTEFLGIGEFAKQIRRNREHVWRVLKGQRQSRRLLEAWNKFKQERAA